MKKILSVLFLIIFASCIYALPKYSVAEWKEAGHGNHRAVIDVTDVSDYNSVYIEWRRRDFKPESKAVVIENEKGEEVNDYMFASFDREGANLVFRPTAPGKYYVYFMPYNPIGVHSSVPNYFFPKTSFSDEEREKVKNISSLPVAVCNEIQARKFEEKLNPGFNNMYPMEVIATEKEVKDLRAEYALKPFILFPEDRFHQIKMFNFIPYHWAVNGPKNSFEGTAQPYEYYVFNVGMYALKNIEKIKVNIGDLKSADGTISAKNITCFNLGGIDWLGKEFTKDVNIADGRVQALWFGIDVPRDAKGVYEGTFEIGAENTPMETFAVKINVDGNVLEDRGDSEIFKLSRIRWLNDTSYLFDDTVPAPYIPLEYRKSGFSVLDRSVEFNSNALMKKYTSRGNQIFAGDMEFNIFSKGQKLDFADSKTGWDLQNKATGIFRSSDENRLLKREITAKAEFDGAINYIVRLTAKEEAVLDDVNMIIPMKKEWADYMLGLGHTGGLRPISWHWKWNPSHTDHQLWIGDVDAGFQLELADDVNLMYCLDFGRYGCPKSWDNNSQGGIDIDEKGSKVIIRAYTGKRTLKAGESIEYHYKMILTPFHKQDPERFNHYRYTEANGTRFVQWHGREYSEYINYPIYNVPDLSKVFEKRALQISYPSQSIPLDKMPYRGAIHIELTPTFEEPLQTVHEVPMFNVSFAERDRLSVAVRAAENKKRIGFSVGTWTKAAACYGFTDELVPGKKAVLSFTWGDMARVYLNGKLLKELKLDYLPCHPASYVKFDGPWDVHKIKITEDPYNGGEVDFAKTEKTVFQGDSFPILTGKDNKRLDGIYFTTRELSVMCPEFFMLQSLGDEVFAKQNKVFEAESVLDFDTHRIYPHIREHSEEDMFPAWHTQAFNGAVDCAVANFHLSRWQNFYVNGMEYLMKNSPIKGYYIDGMAHDREIMKRNARIMEKYRGKDYFVEVHCADQYGQRGSRFSSTNINAEMFAYANELWLGEFYYYTASPANWLTDMSGLTFGVPSMNIDFLYYNTDFILMPYRACLFGMGFPYNMPFESIWNVWDSFGITESETLGWWDKKAPVNVCYKENGKKVRFDKKTYEPILATSFVKKGDKTLIVIASWQGEDRVVSLDIDWKALGLDKKKAKLTAPKIIQLQDKQENVDPDNIKIEANKGLILWLE